MSEVNNGISRRGFIKSGAAAAAGFAGLRRRAAAQTPPRILVGSGEHTYEVIHDWLTPPANIKFGDTHGVAQDSKGNIYVGHTVGAGSQSKDAIVVYDKNGKFLRSWGANFAGGSHGLDIRRENGKEYVYHCDVSRRNVVKTDLDGNVLWTKGLPVWTGVYKEGMAWNPTNVCFAPNGDFYVTDGYGSDYIMQYDQQGNFKKIFGGKGSEPGKVSNAHGIWTDTRGKEPFLVVSDRNNNRLQYLTLDGKHVKFVTNGMRRPCHEDIRGDVMLVPDLDSVVTLLDGDNKVIAHLGDGKPPAGASAGLRGAPREKFIPGQFVHPHDAMFLKNGDILVAEWVPIGRVTLLRKLGQVKQELPPREDLRDKLFG